MTALQICALASCTIAAALLYWTGYRGGLADGRLALLAIADKLRIAAQTFSVFPTAKDQVKETLRLREKALSLAAQIEPKATEHLA